MLGFPKPYPEELLYSTIARAGVHDGETSPKQLLDQVFSNRKVIATVDLPSHVQSIADQYPENSELSSHFLIKHHTLWSIYAPFMPPERVLKLRQWMTNSSQGAAHLASGVAASRVKAKTKLYVCKQCLVDQQSNYGEGYLHRLWQVPLVTVCPIHRALSRTSIELDGKHRHTFIPIESAKVLDEHPSKRQDKFFAEQCVCLLQTSSEGTRFVQWSLFYKQLAGKFGLLNGARIDHSRIREAVIGFWGKSWLEDAGIYPVDTETSWLKSLFRKHRKSFSFAEHIIAVTALTEGQMSILKAIQTAEAIIPVPVLKSPHKINDEIAVETLLTPDQQQWLDLLRKHYPKAARQRNRALYARLYRSHHDWLLAIDIKFHKESEVNNKRVDWSQRDRQCARELKHIIERLADDLNVPHLSRTYLIHHLSQRATVEKNLSRLPRCALLLSLHSESTTEYQARRLTRAYLAMKENHQEIKRWSLLREAGLSDKRMTDLVSELLMEILSE
ncbi:TnsD family Tn7-like transposition protein [Paraglaciecola sp.]|uniref:TnsD family Tn7-like transposition protein n=1 Tax=Paraglaciecola sp. TaxID=1920173 RepID=UPI00273D44A8|nr:TnsD family Tn7-like transposition protein [Paraglaciecola sp.]MDP5032497.1 TnsD family transposase [Paraglaciecola sp.]